MLDPTNIGFRPLEMADLPLMHRWLNTDFVFEWYFEQELYTYENIEKEFIPYIRAEEPNYSYIIIPIRHGAGIKRMGAINPRPYG